MGLSMYTAINLANEKLDQSGFETKKDAEAYIIGSCCNHCIDDLRRGCVEFELEDGKTHTDTIESILHTDCGCVWLIITDEDYENTDSLTDIFIAAGFEPDEETEEKLTFEEKMKLEEKRKEKDENENQ